MSQKKEWMDQLSDLQNEELDDVVLGKITIIQIGSNLEADKEERF